MVTDCEPLDNNENSEHEYIKILQKKKNVINKRRLSELKNTK